MPINATSGDMGLYGQLKLGVDEKTGQVKGTSDVFANAIDEVYKAQLVPKEQKEEKIKDINERLEALSLLETKAKVLALTSADLFHTDIHGNEGAFSSLFANVTSTSATPVGELMGLNMAANSNIKEFTVEIKQVASHDTTTATTAIADTTSDLGWGGSVTLNGQVINFDANQSLDDVVKTINESSDQTNVKASIIKIADNDHRLSFQATEFGSAITIVDSITGTSPGQVPLASGKTDDDLSAKVAFNGMDITRASNTIDDIVDGLTLVVRKAEVGTTVTVQISPDEEKAKEAISAWVESLNELIDEVKKHQEYDLDKQEVCKDAVLNRANIIQTVDNMIKGTLSWVVGGVDTDDFRLLESIGIKRDLQTGKYSIDGQVLDETLKNNFDGVRKAFEYQQSISNSSVQIYEHPAQISSKIIEDSNANALTNTVSFIKDGSGNLTATITVSGGDYAGLTFTVPNNAINFDGDNITFKGEDAVSPGTSDRPFKSFTFGYVDASNIANSSSDSSTVQFTQGFADRMAGNISGLLQDVSGAFALQKAEYASDIKNLEEAITRIETRAEKKKEEFQRQFAVLEAMRQKMQPLEDLLDAWRASMAA